MKGIESLKKSDMYAWFDYIGNNTVEKGRLKSYNNDRKTAFIVFKCNNDWENWFEYTAEGCKYSDIARCVD